MTKLIARTPCEATGCNHLSECLVPDGEGALALCWRCAHVHVEHDVELEDAAEHECHCPPSDIFPTSTRRMARGTVGHVV